MTDFGPFIAARPAATIGGTDLLAFIQSSVTKQANIAALDTYLSATTKTLTNKTLTSPTLTTPTLGVATATSINKMAITAPATSSTLAVADGKTFTVSNTLTLTGTDASSVAFGAGGTVADTNVATLSSLTSIGTIGTGVWQGTAVAAGFGGTGQTTYTKGDLLVTPGSTTISKLAVGTDGQVLTADAASTNGVKWAAGGGSSTLTVGTTATSGGAAGQIMFDTGSVLQESSGLVWDNTNKALSTLGGGTVTTSQPVINATQTWNAGAVAFTGWKLNVTNTASSGSSLLVDLQVGASSKFYVDVSGSVKANVTGVVRPFNWVSGGILTSIGSYGGSYGNFAFEDNSSNLICAFGLSGNWLGVKLMLGGANWSSNNASLTAPATASLQLGAADAASPVAQTLQVQSVVAGATNTAGTDWTLKGSSGTGTGAGGAIVFKTAPAGSTGALQNAAAEVVRLLAAGNVKFTNAANFSANASTATVLTSVGPAGASTTVQEWLTIQNASGTTRYIPCF